ncbi:MAG: hypothetical protein K2V38_09990 [Gemmataceae bacterium]|nr:hypothetical protein [Gemmataceae bacterium]
MRGFRHASAAVLVVAALASTGLAQPTGPTAPDKKAAAVGRMVTIVVPNPDKLEITSYTQAPTDKFDLFREFDPDPAVYRARAIGYEAGVYKVAFFISKNNKVVLVGETEVAYGTPPKPPPGTDPDKPPPDGGKDPPVDPPPGTPAKYYFVVVRPDGPASLDFIKTMSRPGWGKLTVAGHAYKDKTVTEAAGIGIHLPTGTALPCVVTLRVAADGKTSTVERGPVPVPDDPATLTGGLK